MLFLDVCGKNKKIKKTDWKNQTKFMVMVHLGRRGVVLARRTKGDMYLK
jgi:hypothetical protein